MNPWPRVTLVKIDAEPSAWSVDLAHSAFVIIDMQRDFLEPGGFGAALGKTWLRPAVAPCRTVLAAARRLGVGVIHTREGPSPRSQRRAAAQGRARRPCAAHRGTGPMGRIRVRGEPGHDIIAELYPRAGEPVIDKPGKGAFYHTDLDLMLRNRGIETLLVGGVTTEVCVNTTVPEANDRG